MKLKHKEKVRWKDGDGVVYEVIMDCETYERYTIYQTNIDEDIIKKTKNVEVIKINPREEHKCSFIQLATS